MEWIFKKKDGKLSSRRSNILQKKSGKNPDDTNSKKNY